MLPRLRRFAHGLTGNGADAHDLAQTTVERALKARTQWEEGTRLDSWLCRIMRNCWIDAVRSRSGGGRVLLPAEAGEEVGVDPREQIEAGIDLARLLGAMAKLPDEQREVVSLILIEGFGYREA